MYHYYGHSAKITAADTATTDNDNNPSQNSQAVVLLEGAGLSDQDRTLVVRLSVYPPGQLARVILGCLALRHRAD